VDYRAAQLRNPSPALARPGHRPPAFGLRPRGRRPNAPPCRVLHSRSAALV